MAEGTRTAAISAIPTGSLAPDSPSSSVPARPDTSRCPSTENTTAGSVGARAVPTSRAGSQSRPKARCATAARLTAVTSVPATPSQTTGPATARNRRRPMCMPPSSRITASATVTMRSTVVIDSSPSRGTRSDTTAAPIRKRAGAGTRTTPLTRLDSTATAPASPTTSRISPKVSASSTRTACQASHAARTK